MGCGVCSKTLQEKGEGEGETGNVKQGRATRVRGPSPRRPRLCVLFAQGEAFTGAQEGPPGGAAAFAQQSSSRPGTRGRCSAAPRTHTGAPRAQACGGCAVWLLDAPSPEARRPLATEDEGPSRPPGAHQPLPVVTACGSLLSLWTAWGRAREWRGWSLPQRGKEGRERGRLGPQLQAGNAQLLLPQGDPTCRAV